MRRQESFQVLDRHLRQGVFLVRLADVAIAWSGSGVAVAAFLLRFFRSCSCWSSSRALGAAVGGGVVVRVVFFLPGAVRGVEPLAPFDDVGACALVDLAVAGDGLVFCFFGDCSGFVGKFPT